MVMTLHLSNNGRWETSEFFNNLFWLKGCWLLGQQWALGALNVWGGTSIFDVFWSQGHTLAPSLTLTSHKWYYLHKSWDYVTPGEPSDVCVWGQSSPRKNYGGPSGKWMWKSALRDVFSWLIESWDIHARSRSNNMNEQNTKNSFTMNTHLSVLHTFPLQIHAL